MSEKGHPFRFNLAVVILTFVLQALLVATPYIPETAKYWHADSPTGFNNSLAVCLGFQLLLMTAAITIMLLKAAQDQKDAFSEFQQALPITIVKRLTDSQFYTEFLAAVREAKHSVSIAYLAPYPPADIGYKHRKKYDDEILQLMKQQTAVTFRRLIRDSPENREWLKDLAKELRDRPNVDLAVLGCDLPPATEMGLAMSVQIVDDGKAWLVALKAHEIQEDFRDIYIENRDAAAGLRAYYDRIWAVSKKLVSRGRVTNEGEALLK